MIANPLFSRQSKTKGFTLLELLIVITILAILAVIIIFVLNPAETLKKSRDVQRMSDLATLKNSIALYMTTVSSPTLASTDDTGTARTNFSNTACQDTAVGTFATGSDRIYYSLASAGGDGTEITDLTLDDTTFTTTFGATQVTSANNSLTDGLGWIPVKLSNIVGGSPISNLPTDPTNTVATVSTVAFTDLVYRYACSNVSGILNYEINARLESTEFASKMTQDGGDNASLYESGTSVLILGPGSTDQF
ncbi:prepilin-type N-terminal cleavage/methylation domain-containing protein [Patescibacteria group bacterium]|nr:MAG: prepilin-type N-terminal cleavage/methylation domain-containing protein [Patescibacteria group bacterium]